MPRAELSSCVCLCFYVCSCLCVCGFFFFPINTIKHCNSIYEKYLLIINISFESCCIKHFRSSNITNQDICNSNQIYLSNGHASIFRKHAEVSIAINLANKWTAFGSQINTYEIVFTNVIWKKNNTICQELN